MIDDNKLSRLLRSNRPAARQFQSVFFGEVLPSIRKYGAWPKPDDSGDVQPGAEGQALQDLFERAYAECYPKYPQAVKSAS